MKSVSKLLLLGAVAVTALAISAAPSEAAKRKAKGPKPGTYVGQLCSTACNAQSVCTVNIWGHDQKWYQAAFTPYCWKPGCPAAC